MFAKALTVCVFLGVSLCQKEYHDWEVAVVINDQIELLESNGNVIGSIQQEFTRLKAVAFDKVRHQFLVSDERYKNDTIFAVNLTKETDYTHPIVSDLSDDIQGLAVDPIEDVLYWTDSASRKISFIQLNDTTFNPQVLFAFDKEAPQHIAIDVCRRYIYWTNADVDQGSIERARLDGSNREVLVNSNVNMPKGIAIDYQLQRLYWADKGEGIYYRIESARLDGSDRRVVFNGTDGGTPLGVAVDELAVYWTDKTANAIWRHAKSESSEPEKIRIYKDKPPMGLITKNMQIRDYPECQELKEAMKFYSSEEKISVVSTSSKEEDIKNIIDGFGSTVYKCLNGGILNGNSCSCQMGYTGDYCEVNVCHNFCIQGTCQLSDDGNPMCTCSEGFKGERCEDSCTGYCLNGGTCFFGDDGIPTCDCTKDFTGFRCEISLDFTSICKLFCTNNDGEDYLFSKDDDLVCRCKNNDYSISHNSIARQPLAASYKNNKDEERSFLQKLTNDTDYAFMMMGLGFAVFIIFGLSGYIFKNRRLLRYKRPTIRKRIIVNKNVTPLTYRPQPTTEQCEITIENCCNMNICETPCFEPIGRKKDDKKKLLAEMEHHHAEDY